MIVETDMTTYDGTQKEMLAGAIMTWLWSMQPPREVWEAICTSVACCGSTGHGVKFYGDWTMKSGEGWTSCGNTYLNILVQTMAIVAWAKRSTIDLKNSTLFGLGDDNMTFLSFNVNVTQALKEEYITWVERFLSDLGLKPKLHVRSMNDLEYCSGLFYPVGNTRIWGPKPGRVLYKTGWVKADGGQVKTLENGMAELRGTINGLLTTVSHVPVLADLFYNIMEKMNRAGHIKAKLPERIEHMVRANTAHAVTQESEIMLMDRYAIDAQTMQQLRQEASSVKLGSPLTHEVFERMVQIDVGLEPPKPSNLQHYTTPYMALGVGPMVKLIETLLKKNSMLSTLIGKLIAKAVDRLPSIIGSGALCAHHFCVALNHGSKRGLFSTVDQVMTQEQVSQLIGTIFYVLIWAPITEECARRIPFIGKLIHCAIIFVEALGAAAMEGPHMVIPFFVFKSLVHGLYYTQPLSRAILLHMLWNAEVLFSGRFTTTAMTTIVNGTFYTQAALIGTAQAIVGRFWKGTGNRLVPILIKKMEPIVLWCARFQGYIKP